MTTSQTEIPTLLLPPLQSGDRLARDEFEQRYTQMPTHFKAELIEGVVYMPSPVRLKSHGRPHAAIMAWLSDYWIATPGVELADKVTVRLDIDNEVQPDALLRITDECGGQSRTSPDDYLEGPPELVVEIAASSAAYDLHDKLNVYRRNGVQEYIVWSMYPQQLQWFRLHQGRYQRVEPDADGVIRSSVFPGLHLHIDALQAADLPRVMTILQAGLALPEHADFVAYLASRTSGG